MLSIKLACFYKLNQRLENFYQLFSRTSVGPSKCRSDKMICSQDHLRIWRVLWVPSVMAKNSITESFLQMNKFWNEALKNVHCLLSKISLHSVTASWSEASSLSPTVQLDFRWTLNVRSTKWSVCKDIWQSEQFPECNMTSSRGNPDTRTLLSR